MSRRAGTRKGMGRTLLAGALLALIAPPGYDGRVADESANQPIAGGAVGDAARARADALVGRTLLGRYRIDALVATGGLASVFHAARVSDGQEVAIKVLSRRLTAMRPHPIAPT